jgi:serine/threonine-protein kinase
MQIGKFQTIGYIGGGNFGKVFRAHDTLLDTERAIKIIPVQNPQQFVDALTEAQILEKCHHNHIVDIKEIYLADDNGNPVPCIVTEYLPNGSVQGYIENNFVTVQKSCQIITEVLFGLEHAHNQGIFHRDIKPGNILFGNNNQAKLSDFGLAYGLANQAFDFAGYNSHLPPEVLDGIEQDQVSDLYSLGVTFFRILNNLENLDIPYADDAAWLKAIKREKFPARNYQPHIPDAIKRIANKSFKPDRGNRFQTCLELRQAIQKIPLAVEWVPNSESHWRGRYKNDEFELELYKKRTGYCIDFTRNSRKINDRCFVQIPDENTAKNEFFKTIRETTLKV